MKTISIEELEARRSVLVRQLGRVRPLIEGSIATVYRVCGTATCKCHREGGHRQVTLVKKVKGRTRALHVPRDLEETVRRWNDEHKRVKRLLKDISALSEQIMRGYVASRKAEKKRPVLRLVARLVGPRRSKGERRR